MRRNILTLIALAGCAFAGASLDAENRDVTTDLNLANRDALDVSIESLKASENNAFVGRDNADVDIETRDDVGDLVGRSNPDIMARQPQPIPPWCPPRRQANVFIRRGRYPFSTPFVIGFFFRTKRPHTTALYLVYKRSTNDYFYTTSATKANRVIRNQGYSYRGIAGYVFVSRRCGGVPLFRMYNDRRRQHFYTTSVTQLNTARRFGYFFQGFSGYIFRF